MHPMSPGYVGTPSLDCPGLLVDFHSISGPFQSRPVACGCAGPPIYYAYICCCDGLQKLAAAAVG